MLNVKKLIASAESCLGWLYVSPGSNNQNGIDCSGLFERNRFAIACGCAIMKIHAFAFFDYCV